VTDDKTLDKGHRKQLQIDRAATKSSRAKILKLADKTSNLRSLAKSPPADWDLQRRRKYLTFAIDVAKGLRGANGWLEAQFDAAATEAEAVLMQPAAKAGGNQR
jgi:guanosine-3',5'-bis(diphosphate) 3'-pyrophosphohydrolase